MNADVSLPVSVVLPCKNERENIGPLIHEIAAALRAVAHEIIVVDDGSDDGTDGAVAAAASSQEGQVRLIRHDRSSGQSAAVRTGMLAARGDVVVTIDGDGQNDPQYIPALLSALATAGAGTALAGGQRVGRKASFAKRHGSRLANKVRRALLNDDSRDTGCGLKAIRREVFLLLPYFDGWHRFMPALVKREGYAVTAVDVVDRPRRFGSSKYGIFDRLWVGIADLFGVWWLTKRRRVIPRAREERLNE
ncbi:Glycosyltransferase involved in cell wall bisynthesis [Faunimonas pinastri]|uniref:Glycosyltransferase involved in cell wall bisynthesis n=1 Tax=Faunimonas pinastri TaxID=1855383 RepID=A0A1H9CJY6_9HYPH|nr:glycosyltransferase family 2 protein [Faunimonas pinastri]SEQ01474.1 Glycosyltransferase involved in cell wall bisynthesis [Faunimonas pinastri]